MKTLSLEQQLWANQHFPLTHSEPLVGDAGFRRYFRLHVAPEKNRPLTLIFMDASEEPAIYRAFIQQTAHLKTSYCPIPAVLAQHDTACWAILDDFGDDQLWKILQDPVTSLGNADRYYRQAIRHLIVLHHHPVQAYGRCSILDQNVICEELSGWQEWCLEALFQQTASESLQACYALIAEKVSKQPYVFMHRDFHSKNILRKVDGSLGIIDYQDAMSGPISYDIASLLRDCYIDWPEDKVIEWALYYKQLAQESGLLSSTVSDAIFLAWFDWTSIQRHLKALLTFARKSLRDQNHDYLVFIPRTLRYIDTISSRYAELAPLMQVIRQLREKYDH